jgi:hypothetical protein
MELMGAVRGIGLYLILPFYEVPVQETIPKVHYNCIK